VGVEAIVFDWGGVLAGDVSSGFTELEERLGVPAGTMPQLLGLHPCETDTANLWHLRELGRATASEWAQWYCDRVRAAGGPSIPPELIVASESDRFSMDPNAAVVAAARRWKAAGYRLGVCTNNFAELGSVWRARLPMELFDAVVVSCEIGVRKPDPEMYAHVTEALDAAPAATVLLDDFAGNVNGARAVGWQAILVGSDQAAAIAELEGLLGSPDP
jgi:epoxide hydrolase-like predicted phosphatase